MCNAPLLPLGPLAKYAFGLSFAAAVVHIRIHQQFVQHKLEQYYILLVTNVIASSFPPYNVQRGFQAEEKRQMIRRAQQCHADIDYCQAQIPSATIRQSILTG